MMHTLLAELDRLAQLAPAAPLVVAAAARLGVCPQTIYRRLREMGWRPSALGEERLGGRILRARRRRADAGEILLSFDDAQIVSALMMEGFSEHAKQRMTLKHAVEIAYANGRISGPVSPETGEIIRLSTSTFSRALRHYKLDMESLRAPTPKTSLRTEHPNQMWEADASVCTLWYLPQTRTHVIERVKKQTHYKNKPENLKAIEKCRVIRYVMTDHTSGLVRVRYYPGAECGEHYVSFFAWLMAPKSDPTRDPFHGVPEHIMLDPGAGNSAVVRRFLNRIGVNKITNRPHAPWVKGQVEQANNLWESTFEAGLIHRQHEIRGFDDLNALAETYQLWLNASKEHSRHGMTRMDAWLHIRPEQLRAVHSETSLLAVAQADNATPTVDSQLCVRYLGERYSVRHVPGVTVGTRLTVFRSPFSDVDAMAEVEEGTGEKTKTTFIPLTAHADDGWGFDPAAAKPGECYIGAPDTEASRNAKALSRFASGAKTDEEDKALRRRKDFVPFGGEINPYREAEAAQYDYLPRASTPLPDAPADAVPRVLTATRAAMRAKDALGERWQPEMFAFMQARFREGVTEEALARLIAGWAQNKEASDGDQL